MNRKLISRNGAVVPQLTVVGKEVDHVEAEAVDALVHPETHNVGQGLAHLGLIPVQIGLLLEEGVVVVLPAPLVPGPGRSAEKGEPVIWHRAIWFGVRPDVPVGLGVVPAPARFLKPGVLFRAVVENQVDHHPNAPLMRGFDQRLGIAQTAEDGIDAAVVGHVVAEVGHGGGEEG